jgi:hypothetical protein
MAHPYTHKTVFVLDNGPSFQLPCEKVELDFHKNRMASGYIPPAPVVKTMWTCVVESVLEYCRIVWDIFPTEKLIRFVVSNQDVRVLNSWNGKEQNLGIIAAGLASSSLPDPQERSLPPRKKAKKSSSITGALAKALELLCEPTRAQISTKEQNSKLINRGRIICLTHAQDDHRVEQVCTSQ